MINGVNFGAISTDPTIKLQDATIAQPNNNSLAPAPSTPAAAAEVKGDSFEKKGKGAKVAVGFLATVAAGLTALALLVKKGKLSPKVLPEGGKLSILDHAQNMAHTVGKKTLDIATDMIDKAKKILKKEKADDIKPIPREGDPDFIGPLRPRSGDENFIGPPPPPKAE